MASATFYLLASGKKWTMKQASSAILHLKQRPRRMAAHYREHVSYIKRTLEKLRDRFPQLE